GIKQIASAPFHPSSSSQAERTVSTTKVSLSTVAQREWEYKLANFLFCLCVTFCTTAWNSATELLIDRQLRIVLDSAHPDIIQEHADKNLE
ncbi:hypothetical protein T4D_6943, partial [Trichinella pseudospiralis]